ncbi:SKI family transcriptional corepressor 2-like [Neopsephotus bourkii]|uniref:SKI family transcriptional corepressor 2-like n=1 Tax=Neopsephotus bourkii TaxID=309878 RepID=UPI002AA5C18E|nr:SKI family transcriptional corepressor 2-like [Neopsephotus bourkii]
MHPKTFIFSGSLNKNRWGRKQVTTEKGKVKDSLLEAACFKPGFEGGSEVAKTEVTEIFLEGPQASNALVSQGPHPPAAPPPPRPPPPATTRSPPHHSHTQPRREGANPRLESHACSAAPPRSPALPPRHTLPVRRGAGHSPTVSNGASAAGVGWAGPDRAGPGWAAPEVAPPPQPCSLRERHLAAAARGRGDSAPPARPACAPARGRDRTGPARTLCSRSLPRKRGRRGDTATLPCTCMEMVLLTHFSLNHYYGIHHSVVIVMPQIHIKTLSALQERFTD